MARGQQHAVLDDSSRPSSTSIYLFKQTMFATWLWNTMFIALVSRR